MVGEFAFRLHRPEVSRSIVNCKLRCQQKAVFAPQKVGRGRGRQPLVLRENLSDELL
jgi:hypothetical protein